MSELKLSFVFEVGSDNDPKNRASIEDLAQLGKFLNESDFCMLADYVGWRLEATDTYVESPWDEFIEETSLDEESTDDPPNHPEPENQNTQQEIPTHQIL